MTKSRLLNVLLIVIIISLFAGGAVLLVREYVLLPDADFVMPETPLPGIVTPAPVSTPSKTFASQTPKPSPSPTPYVKPVPVKISFIDQKQSCEVFPGGILENGEMEVIDRADAASWLVYSAAPGEEGNSIIAGHRSKNHVAGTFKALWYVEINDAVVIDFEDGSQRWFYISSINRYPFDEVDPSVMEFDGETRLTLITCIGEWDNAAGTSSERMVVVCRPGIPETGN